MNRKILATLALAALCGAAFAAAPEFNAVDANEDGRISAEEGRAVGMDISRADANQDGSLDAAEYEAATKTSE